MKACAKRYDTGGGLMTTCERPKKHKGVCGPYRHKLIDQEATRLLPGDPVTFVVSERSIVRNGFVVGRDRARKGAVSVQLIGDPFPVGVLPENLKKGHHTKMPTTATPDRKEMRKTAKKLGIPDWEGMTEKQLASAIKKFKKTKAEAPAKTKAKANGKGSVTKTPRGQTKADKGEPVTPTEKAKAAKSKNKPVKESKKPKSKPSKKAPKTAAQGVEPAANGNPFRPGSNAFKHTELLIKGGSRASIINKLLKSIEFHPWGGKKAAKRLYPVKTMDKRLLMTTHQLQHLHGFTIVMWGGRGPEKSSIQVFPPKVAVPAALAAKATLINGSKPGAAKAKTKPVAAKKTRAKTGTSKPKAAKKTTTKAKKKAKK